MRFVELTYWPGETKALVNVDRVVSIRPDAHAGTLLDFDGWPGRAPFHASEDFETVRAMVTDPPANAYDLFPGPTPGV